MFLIIGERNHKVIRHIHISHNAPHLHFNLVPRWSLVDETEGENWSSKKIQFCRFARLWASDVSAIFCSRYGVLW